MLTSTTEAIREALLQARGARPLLPLGTRVSITPARLLLPVERALLLTLPGVSVARRTGVIHGPVHAAPLVGALLDRMAGAGGARAEDDGREIRVSVEDPPWVNTLPASYEEAEHRLRGSEVRPETIDSIREIDASVIAALQRAGDPLARTHPYRGAYQLPAVLFLACNGGGSLWHSTGAGKSPVSLAAALCHPWTPAGTHGPGLAERGALLIVTPAFVRPQWGRTVTRFTSLVPWVSDPDARGTARYIGPEAYRIRCWEYGRRPVYIVGWEELAPMVFGAGAYEGRLAARLGGVGRGRGQGGGSAGLADASDGAEVAYLARHPRIGPIVARRLLDHFSPAPRGGLAAVQDAPEAALQALLGKRRGTAIRMALDAGPTPARAEVGAELLGVLRRIPFSVVILDELHRARSKNRAKWSETETGKLRGKSRGNLTAAAAEVSRLAQWRIGGSATPISTSKRDLYAQGDLIEPGAWGKGYTRWQKRYLETKPAYVGLDDTGDGKAWQRAELAFRLGLSGWGPAGGVWASPDGGGGPRRLDSGPLWRSVDRCTQTQAKAGLPPMHRTVRWIGLGEQCPADPAAVRELREATTATARAEARLAIDCSRKRPAVVREVLGAEGLGTAATGWRKVIVFTGRRWDVRRLREALLAAVEGGAVEARSAAAVQQAAYLTGEDSATVRDAAAQAFMAHNRADGPCLLVATGQSMGTGIDLHDADRLIEALLSTTPEYIEQREGRVWRRGQQVEVEIRYLLCEGGEDERLMELLKPRMKQVAANVALSDADAFVLAIQGLGDPQAVLAAMSERRLAAWRRGTGAGSEGGGGAA